MTLPTRDRAVRIAREVAILAVVAVVQLGMTTGASHSPWQQDAAPLWPWGYLLLGAAVAVLPLRHRHPRAALAAVFALTLGYWVTDLPHGPVFIALIVAFARVVADGHRRTAIAVAVLGFLLFPWLGYVLGVDDPPTQASLLGLFAWLVALISITEALRFRRDRARERERSQAEARARQVGEERLRIAREVHDAVAHAMSLITIQAGVALHRGEALPKETREALTVIRSTSREALVELRGILGVLRDMDGEAPRAPTPGLSRLDDLRTWAGAAGLDLRLTAHDLPPGGLPGTVDVAAYRILQEALTNAVRHAGPCRVTADVRVADGELVVEVLDDGRGAGAGPTVGSGNGIVGMQERAAAVGGSLTAGPRAGGGFAVRARLPLPAPSDEQPESDEGDDVIEDAQREDREKQEREPAT
jgi:signal transduction histidine kinase